MEIFKSKWSNWVDLCAGSFEHHPYLLQGSRHKNGKVKFRVVSTIKTAWYASDINLEKIKSL